MLESFFESDLIRITNDGILYIASAFFVPLIFILINYLQYKLFRRILTDGFLLAVKDVLFSRLVYLGVIIGVYILLAYFGTFYSVSLFYIANGFFLLLWVFWVLSAVINRYYKIISQKGSYLAEFSVIKNLVIVFVFAILFLIQLNLLGINIGPALAALGVGSLAVALALKDTLENFFAGIQLVLSKKFRYGDYVVITEMGLEGVIIDTNWSQTTILNIAGEEVIIPNIKFNQSSIRKISQKMGEAVFIVPFSVAYGSNLEKVDQIASQVVRSVCKPYLNENIFAEIYDKNSQASHVLTIAMADSGIEYIAVLRMQNYAKNRSALRADFIKLLHSKFFEEDIQFPFPTRTLYIHNQTKEV